MKLGIIGLPGSGKATIFDALTKQISDTAHKGDDRIGTIQVPDSRLDTLSEMHAPPKTTHAQIEYFLPATAAIKKSQIQEQSIWTAARGCDALLEVIRNHTAAGYADKSPYDDYLKLEQELILNDLVLAESRLERIEIDHKRGKKMDPEEHSLLIQCRGHLENEIPLRKTSDLASARKLKGFEFLSAKPMLVLFNNDDDDEHMPEINALITHENCLVIRGKLEQELAQMSIEEADEFLNEFNIPESAMDRVIRKSYQVLGLISFFTIGKKEIRAWTIHHGTHAVDAADKVHTDMKKGFIRAEVLSFSDLLDAGTYTNARKKGTVRLEGKTYEVQDGDIINFRFNV